MNKEHVCYEMMKFSVDRNVVKKEAIKILKLKDLKIETQSKWNVKKKVISVIKRLRWSSG